MTVDAAQQASEWPGEEGLAILRLRARYYRAHPSSAQPGLTEEDLELKVEETAFVELHCWNIGFPEGPPAPPEYWVGMGSPEDSLRAGDIIVNRIKPAMEAARQAGLPIIHVQPRNVAKKYSQSKLEWEEEKPRVDEGNMPEPIEGYRRKRAEKVHGPGYMEWKGWKQLDIPNAVKPQPEDYVVATGGQLDRILRRLGVVNLIYTGFATNLCILDSPAAMKEMAGKGYRTVLLRECTLACEFPDTVKDLLNTKVALRYVEAWVGYTAGQEDFLRACQSAALERRKLKN